jgi:hypothetical protein
VKKFLFQVVNIELTAARRPGTTVPFFSYCCGVKNLIRQADQADGIPIVAVTAPDGRKSLWVAVVAPEDAVAAVVAMIPPNYIATLTRHRLTLSRRVSWLGRGEVRRIKL